MKKLKPILIALILLVLISFWYIRMINHKPSAPAWLEVKHMTQLKVPGKGEISVDPFEIGKILDTVQGTANFIAYQVEFKPAVSNLAKEQEELAIYYQYQMASDWRLVAAGDTIKPVFSQPVTKLSTDTYTVILVFEDREFNQNGKLLFEDSRAIWGKQQVLINKYFNKRS